MLWEDPLLWAGAAVAAALAAGIVLLALGRRRPAPVPVGAGEAANLWVAGLAKTRGNLVRRMIETWRGPGESEVWLADLEAILLSADVGVKASTALIDGIRPHLGETTTPEALRALLQNEMRKLLADAPAPRTETRPEVILVVGVNGVGKTTTIGKLAHRFASAGKKVLLVAGDTFRAAAIEQLALWAERTGAEIVKHQHGADPAAVAFDGVKAAQARGADVVLIDTAGRLHVKANLMEELKKIARTIARLILGAPHQVLLVIDATTGQNALNQARMFHEAIAITGVVLAKLDGTAKGGVALAIRQELGLPIRYVGLGEKPEDLAPFDADEFVAGLFANG